MMVLIEGVVQMTPINYTQGAKDVARVIRLVGMNYTRVAEKFGGNKHFGCLALHGQTDLRYPLSCTVPFGLMPEETRCFELAPEKVARLVRHPLHVSSFQSRAVNLVRYGGAIRLPKATSQFIGYMGWSAHPELVDEAFMLVSAVMAGLMTYESGEEIAAISKNPHFAEMMRRLPLM